MTKAPEKIYLAILEHGNIDLYWYDEKPDKPSPFVQDVEYRRADLPPKVKGLGKAPTPTSTERTGRMTVHNVNTGETHHFRRVE